jgi:hypothetical protein
MNRNAAACASAAPAALVVIGGAGAAPPAGRSAVDVRSTIALAASLPPAHRVLQIGGDDALHSACVTRDGTAWRAWHRRGGDRASLQALHGAGFDLIVLPEGLAALEEPLAALRSVAAAATPDATLCLAQPNHATPALLQRWLEADLTDDDGTLATRHGSLGSMPSAYKLLMDSGWMPTLAATVAGEPAHPTLQAALVAAAGALQVPATTAMQRFGAARLIVHARRSFAADEPPAGAAPARALFDVVVPTTRDRQLRANVECSPGLRETAARIVSVRRAPHPAAAIEIAREHTSADWLLLCHQDVYFASGFGGRLNALLAAISADERPRTLIGFAGIGVDKTQQGLAPAGFVIDRTTRADWCASDQAVSIDELAIVVARDSVHRLDPALGWHLWATDLCLTAITQHRVFPRIVRMPLFHNSVTDHTLPAAFHASAARLAAKHPDWGPIHTLCGVIDAAFLARHRRLPS